MKSAEAVKAYYTAALERADYYIAGTEVVGKWRGRGAEILDLRNAPIDQRTFGLMADNLHPQRPTERLTARTSTNRRVGYDFTFSPPKGVSVMHALTGDDRLRDAFLEAVRITMSEMEQSMQTRVRAGANSDGDRATKNWVYGEFLHLTARPTTTGGAPDPQMHCHCTVLNASFDGIEQRWKAGQFGSIMRDANYFEAAFHARLSRAVLDLGYRVKKHGKYWELADLPDSLIAKFVKRTDAIEKEAKERGITEAKAKDRLGAETRAKKSRGLSSTDLSIAWMSQLSDAEVAALHAARLRSSASPQRHQLREKWVLETASIDFALEHLYERLSVASDRKIAETALRHGVAQGIEVAELWRELKRRTVKQELFQVQVGDQQICTTPEAYAETSRCIDFTRKGMGACRALAPGWEIERPELLVASASDQSAAIRHVLTSTDRVIAVRGRAGTGKTFALQEIAAALAQAGHRMQTLAPTSQAVDVLRKDGFVSADTVAQLLANKKLQESLAGAVLVIDEAGLLSARQLDRLFRIADEQNCRVLIQYDLGQHRSVERGSPVRDLERYAGLEAAKISVVRRQKPKEYRSAVEDLMAGKVEKAFARLTAMDAFLESADSEERQQRLAKDYLVASRKPGSKVLVISPTHREGDAVTRAIRGILRGAGRIQTEEQETTVLQRGGLTAAQRGEASSYFPDQVVQFTQNTSAHQRGERLVVKERLPDGTVLVQQCAPSGTGIGASFELGLGDKDSFEVYTPKRIGISVGDRIRITANGYVPILSENEGVHDDDSNRAQPNEAKQTKSRGKKKPERRRLINNAMYVIKNLTKGGDFVLDNGWVLPRSYGHFAHGYCTTSHASQGMTVDTVLISQSAESFGASSLEQFYVSCSRGKSGIKIYTDSVAELARAVIRSDQPTSAADLLASSGVAEHLIHSSDLTHLEKWRSLGSRPGAQMAINAARLNSSDLVLRSIGGVECIDSLRRVQLRTGGGKDFPQIIMEDQTRRRNTVVDRGEQVCGPRHPADPRLAYAFSHNKLPAAKMEHTSAGASLLLPEQDRSARDLSL